MFARCGFAIYDNFLFDIDTINDTFIFYFSKYDNLQFCINLDI